MGRVVANRSESHLSAGPAPRLAGPLPAAVLDLIAVLLFVGVGRVSHDESLSLPGYLATAWPFLIGLGGGYLGLVLTRWPATSLRGGCMVAGKTIVLGLVIRFGIQREGTPFAFIVVTALVITGLMLGWRLLAGRRTEPASAEARAWLR